MRTLFGCLVAVGLASPAVAETAVGSVANVTESIVACEIDRIRRLAELTSDIAAYKRFIALSIVDGGCAVIPTGARIYIEKRSGWDNAVQIRVSGDTRSLWAIAGVVRDNTR